MAWRLSWSRMDSIGAGVLLAAVLGFWQAARVADVLGFGPESETSSSRQQDRRAARVATKTTSSRSEQGSRGRRPATGSDTVWWAESTSASDERPPAEWSPLGAALPMERGPSFAPALRPEAEQAEAERFATDMARLIRDLEYTKGLPEPVQQVVVPPPAPWTPPPTAKEAESPVIEAMEPRDAPAQGGTLVVLRGRNLRVAQVMFGSAPARIAEAAPGAITVEAPPGGAGQVTIAVTNADGTYALVGQPFTYGR